MRGLKRGNAQCFLVAKHSYEAKERFRDLLFSSMNLENDIRMQYRHDSDTNQALIAGAALSASSCLYHATALLIPSCNPTIGS